MRRWGTLDIFVEDSNKRRYTVIGKISLVPIRLRSGNLKSTSWWSILDVLVMSAHRCLHRNFQWWILQTLKLWQRTTWHWNIVAWQSSSITIMIASYFETRQWIWYLTIVIPTCTKTLTNGIPPRRALVVAGENAANDVDEEVYGNAGAERHEAQEASAGDRRAIADADQAGQLDISGEAKMRDHFELLNRRQMPREWRTTRHMFHSEIGVQSVASRGRSSPHRRVLVNKKRRIHCRNSRQTTCSFEQWQRVKLSHVSHSRKRAVEWWSASCAPRKVVMRLDERNPETFDGFLNPVIIRCD